MPSVKIFNAPGYMGDMGYFHACALASHDTCLVQDLNTINPSLDALYLKWSDQSSPFQTARVTAAVSPSELHLLRHLHFQNALQVDLHSGFTWLRSALFHRHLAHRFLSQLTTCPAGLPTRNMLAHSSLFFALWTNTYPDLLRTDLEWLDIEGPPAVEVWERPATKGTVVSLF